jgi:TonB family protein
MAESGSSESASTEAETRADSGSSDQSDSSNQSGSGTTTATGSGEARQETSGSGSGASLEGCAAPPEIDFNIEVRPIVSVDVAPSGEVTDARIVRSSGKDELDEAALDYAQSCQFSSSENGISGQQIAVKFVQP